MNWDDELKQVKAEGMAFEHAASLVKEYRNTLRASLILNCVLAGFSGILLVVMLIG